MSIDLRVGFAFMLAIGAMRTVSAQTQVPLEALRRVFANADSGTRFRVQLSGGPQLHGRLVRLDSAILLLDAGPAVSLRSIGKVRERDRAWLRVGIVGSVSGVVLASFVFWSLSAVLPCDHCDSSRKTELAIVGTGGAATGFALGAALGALVPVWRQRYP